MCKKQSPPDAAYVYVLTRLDLPQPHRSVQIAHAVLAATLSFGSSKVTHPHLVVCVVADEAELDAAFNRLKEQDVPCCAYYEDDMANALTAVATGLLVGKERQPLRRYSLMK